MYKIYRDNNYIVIQNTIKNEWFYGHAKDVFIDKSNVGEPIYTIKNVKNFKEKETLKIGQILKENGSTYTESEWDEFYKENTGFNTSSGGSGETDGNTSTINVIKLTLSDIGASDFDDNVKTKMLAYLQSEGVTIEAGVMPVIELNDVFSYNFEVEADWTANSVTDEASFVTFMDSRQDGSGVTVTDFVLDGDWVRCNLSNSDSVFLDLTYGNISKVLSIGDWDILGSATLDFNSLTDFNLKKPLPISLNEIYLNDNSITTLGYAESEEWANVQPPFTNTCLFNFSGNTDSITGTTLETILLTKNVTITA